MLLDKIFVYLSADGFDILLLVALFGSIVFPVGLFTCIVILLAVFVAVIVVLGSVLGDVYLFCCLFYNSLSLFVTAVLILVGRGFPFEL